MKSPEVYSHLKLVLAPWFKAQGFKRAKGSLAWCRPHGCFYIVVWCQISQDGWDPYRGSRFIVEFQFSSEPQPGAGGRDCRRERFAGLLSADEREEVRRIQNEVIRGLHRPPPDHHSLQVSEDVTKWYLASFNTVDEPYPERHDIWFRYASPQHVTRWAHFIAEKLPRIVSAVESWGDAASDASVP